MHDACTGDVRVCQHVSIKEPLPPILFPSVLKGSHCSHWPYSHCRPDFFYLSRMYAFISFLKVCCVEFGLIDDLCTGSYEGALMLVIISMLFWHSGDI